MKNVYSEYWNYILISTLKLTLTFFYFFAHIKHIQTSFTKTPFLENKKIPIQDTLNKI